VREERLENEGLKGRRAKRRAIHFFGGQDERFDALRDGMARRANRNFFRLEAFDFAPAAFQIARRFQHRFVSFGIVARMKRHETEAVLVNRRFDELRHGVFDFAMTRVAPPDQHIITGEFFGGDTLIGVVQIRGVGLDLTFAELVEGIGDSGADACGIEVFFGVRRVFVPHENANDILAHGAWKYESRAPWPRVGKPLPVLDAPFRPLAVLFDLDGTLLNTFAAVARAWNAAMEPIVGRSFDPVEVAARFGPPDEEMLEAAFPDSLARDERDAAIERYFAQYAVAHAQIEPFPGIESLLDELGTRQMPMGIVTGKGRRAADLTLAHFGWTSRFAVIVAGGEVARPKPDPEGVLRVARELGAEPNQCVFIGDSPADIGAAKNAGMVSVVAGWHDFYLNELEQTAPDFWPQSPFELGRWFEARLD